VDFVHAVLFYVVLLISLVVHEAAHALAALWGGDKTAYLGGQVTLNPMPHIQREPFGTVLLPIGMLVLSGGQMCMGYAHTPIDPIWAYRHPKKAALMSAAGPMSNFMLAGLAGLTLKILMSMELVEAHQRSSLWERFLPADGSTEGALFATCEICVVFVLLNLLLGLLNLIPWPPLDGAGILGGFFPKLDRLYQYLRTQPFIMLAGFVGVFYMIQGWLGPAFEFTFRLIRGG